MIFLRIDSIGGACPMQAEGVICDKPFYFRARHGEWTLTIAETRDAAIEGIYPLAGSVSEVLYHAEGDDLDLGFMPIEVAVQHIAAGMCAYMHKLFDSPEEVAHDTH